MRGPVPKPRRNTETEKSASDPLVLKSDWIWGRPGDYVRIIINGHTNIALQSGQRRVMDEMTITLMIFFFDGQYLGSSSSSDDDSQLTMMFPSASTL